MVVKSQRFIYHYSLAVALRTSVIALIDDKHQLSLWIKDQSMAVGGEKMWDVVCMK